MFYKLNKRQERILKDVDVYFDILSKFTKEESKAYLEHVNDARMKYVNKLAKYAKDNRRKRIEATKGKPNSHYLAYAQKVISKLFENS